MSELPGRIGDYLIESELGVGGMATVYKARHAILETSHALKVLDPSYRSNESARQRFLDEAKIQAKILDHPNIVKVTNIVATADHAALVMELVDGPSLESKLGELKADPALITRIMLGILDGVQYAHEAGIIHRDLKPANVLLARQRGGELLPKVSDFGIAKIIQGEDRKSVKKSTHADARMGTLHYMSPEQVRRSKDVTVRSDVFSLGAMLYEMATGATPFGGDSEYDLMENIIKGRYAPPERAFSGIDPVIAAVIVKALAPEPADRFASCKDMALALRGEVAVTPPIAPREAQSPPRAPDRAATPPTTKRRWLPLAIGGGVVAAGAIAAIVLTRGHAKKGFTTGEQLLDAIVAVDGERMARHTGIKLTGTMRIDGHAQKFNWVTAAQDRLYTLDLGDGGTYQEGMHDGVVWELRRSGPTLITGKERERALREDAFNAQLHWRNLYSKAELAGTDTIDGIPAYKLVLTALDGDVHTWYVAKDSLQTVHETSARGEVTYSDLRDLDGIKMAYKSVHKQGADTYEIITDAIELDPKLPPEFFALPAEVEAARHIAPAPAPPTP